MTENIHPDDHVLLSTLAKRSDLSVPRPQTHFLDFPDEASAQRLLAAVSAEWTPVGVTRKGQVWRAAVARADKPTNRTTIPVARTYLTGLAESVGGRYFGWEATTDVGLRHHDDPADEFVTIEQLNENEAAAINQLLPALNQMGLTLTPENLANFARENRARWLELNDADGGLTRENAEFLIGTAAGEQIGRATGLRWIVIVQGEDSEIALADAERGLIRPYAMAADWWDDPESEDVADFVRAAILLVTTGGN
ncbi:ribonuclease E inhibitor RraB [Corynebacterium guangdongense]|uniref:Regulator of ribonuclease activity B domain-containing protein n=1 Tax=Corynebacterium guangdongense TaxID=1783348 RepID=A0ABU2A1A2_9CORY|nr:ribonuclease E inhibitor RraB [Corynebacterium guangdongense]MDR7330880.1 hypothetical protein [Corynebacterium guangdongense]WJZ16895.1 hypothetical protein CGUA_01475 [Corynebacterium guangdongense]